VDRGRGRLSAADPAELPRAQLSGLRREPLWRALHSREIAASTFSYRSGGHLVTGFIVRPTRISGRRPVLIWGRGGIGDVRQSEAAFAQMATFARQGYIVVGSNYRGSAGSEGRDEFGGAEVEDLLSLAPLIRTIPDADPDAWFGIAFSRGGTMLYRAVAEGLRLRAFVTLGGLTNVAASLRERPQIEQVFRRMMPDFEADRAGNFCRRSATCWPERLAAPLLLIHGGSDESVSPAQAQELAAGLERVRRPYRLLFVGGGNHELAGHRQLLFAQALAFFREHGAPAGRAARP
jgi:dipeptidyl aminopeptidase/acylaminoacyl peptidase